MIAKGTTHNSGARLATYLVTGKENERAELGQLRGFASDDIKEAFRSVHVMADATRCEQPFFHVQVRNPEGEKLTREQWERVADRIESKLGMSGQARAIAFHTNTETGHEHMHIAWSRIDGETMTARALPFFKIRLKEVCRELEFDLGLTRVTSERHGPCMAPLRNEFEQARRLGTDIHETRATIRECWEHSDNGRSFAAALSEKGFTLAQGERRDYVAVDPRGGIHALGKRILGQTADEVRKRIGGSLDREALPTVEEVRGRMGRSRSGATEDLARTTAIDDRDAAAVIRLMTKQRATFSARDLDLVLAKHFDDVGERKKFVAEVLGHEDVVRLSAENGGKTRYTTATVLETEQHVLRAAAGLARDARHEMSMEGRAAVLNDKRFEGITREQVLAVRHATGAEGIALIDGQAGTGKTYTMTAIRAVYQAQGYGVIGLAPTNAVAHDLKEEGFDARTIHSELYALNNGRGTWNNRTVVMIDEAAMIDTRNIAMLTAHAEATGAKLILTGDDRQLASIERGGMFTVLKDRYGAAELTEVRRQHENDDRQAASHMANGRFKEALASYAAKDGIHWAATQSEAAEALVQQWAKDSAADPSKSRFVFAYTNQDVNELNGAIRTMRQQRGEIGASTSLQTKHGRAEFGAGDRLQFTGTDKKQGLYNGQAGTVQKIDGTKMTVVLDGRKKRIVEFDATEFKDFRHGYAGTIYKGQGRTIDQTYLFHSDHWRSSSSYVALTRHREKAQLFVGHDTAKDLKDLARQMARIDDRRAASQFRQAEEAGPVRPLAPLELAAWLESQEKQPQKTREPQKVDWRRYMNDRAYREQVIAQQHLQRERSRQHDRDRSRGGLER